MKTLFLVSQPPGLNWYRCHSFLKHMSRCSFWPKYPTNKLPNWDYALNTAFKDDQLKKLDKALQGIDVVVAQRVGTPMAIATLFALKDRHHYKLLCEIDDDAFNIDSSNPAQKTVHSESDQLWCFKKQLTDSDGVITSTEHLKKLYAPHNGNIRVIKNGIDFNYWGKPTHRQGGNIRIGWQGAWSHDDDLSILSGVIPKILKKYKNVEFYFFGHTPDFLKDIVKSFPMVTIDKYPKFLKSKGLDIILAPLQDTMFNRGKSNIRCLEAGAMELPVVASRGDKLPYESVIKHDETGLLASTTDEWVDCLSQLIESRRYRERLGQALYKKVKKEYNVKDIAKDYERVLSELRTTGK